MLFLIHSWPRLRWMNKAKLIGICFRREFSQLFRLLAGNILKCKFRPIMVLHWMLYVSYFIVDKLKNSNNMARSSYLKSLLSRNQLNLIIPDSSKLEIWFFKKHSIIFRSSLWILDEFLGRNQIDFRRYRTPSHTKILLKLLQKLFTNFQNSHFLQFFRQSIFKKSF